MEIFRKLMRYLHKTRKYVRVELKLDIEAFYRILYIPSACLWHRNFEGFFKNFAMNLRQASHAVVVLPNLRECGSKVLAGCVPHTLHGIAVMAKHLKFKLESTI